MFWNKPKVEPWIKRTPAEVDAAFRSGDLSQLMGTDSWAIQRALVPLMGEIFQRLARLESAHGAGDLQRGADDQERHSKERLTVDGPDYRLEIRIFPAAKATDDGQRLADRR